MREEIDLSQRPYGSPPEAPESEAIYAGIFVFFAVWLGIAYVGDHVPVIGALLRAIF